MTKVAVYGSLRSGMGNHRLLAHIADFAEGETVSEFKMYSLGGFPAIVAQRGSKIKVEVYEVDDDTFARLDMLEGYPSFYNRQQVDILLEDGTIDNAWIYFIEDDSHYVSHEVVEDGDWVNYRMSMYSTY